MEQGSCPKRSEHPVSEIVSRLLHPLPITLPPMVRPNATLLSSRRLCYRTPWALCSAASAFRQHTTVHPGTRVTPGKVMFGCDLPSPLHAILPANAARSNPSKMAPRSSLLHKWELGQTVLMQKRAWLLGQLPLRAGCRVQQQDGLLPLLSSAPDRSPGALPDTSATLVIYFGLTRCCGCCVASCRAILAIQPPFCVTNGTFPGASSTNHMLFWSGPARPPAANVISTCSMLL